MIYKKLLDLQQKNITPSKDGKNPHFGSTYVTLNEVLNKLKAPLNEMGVVIIQKPSTVDGAYGEQIAGLKTVLYDTEDDTFVESFIPYVGTIDAQKLGGCITYFRRYSLMALCGLEDEDDDGNAASSGAKPRAKRAPVAGESHMTRTDDPFEEQPFSI